MPIWSVYPGYIPDFTLALPFKQLILEREDGTVLRTIYPPHGLKGVEMGYIRERNLSDGSKRFYAEVELKGAGPRLTATFNRRNNAKLWIQKSETELRCGKNQLIAESRKHIFKEAVQKYSKEQKISVVKRGHLQWGKRS